MVETSIDIMPLLAGALMEEQHFWREGAACHVSSLVYALNGGGRMHLRPIVPKSALRRELIETVEALQAALAGDFYGSCEACGEPVRPGDATIQDVECGEMHADCCASNSQQPIKPGDKVYLDPEAIVQEPGEPPTDHIVAGVASYLLTDKQIAERLAAGAAVLAAAARAG